MEERADAYAPTHAGGRVGHCGARTPPRVRDPLAPQHRAPTSGPTAAGPAPSGFLADGGRGAFSREQRHPHRLARHVPFAARPRDRPRRPLVADIRPEGVRPRDARPPAGAPVSVGPRVEDDGRTGPR